MEKKKARGRPKKPIEGELKKKLIQDKNKGVRQEGRRQRFGNRYYSRRGNGLTAIDIKFIKKGGFKNSAMIDLNKYKLNWKDELWQELWNKHKKMTLGQLALCELESLCGKIPCGTDLERRLVRNMEHEPCATIYANPQFINKIVDKYYDIDRDSAYPSEMTFNRMPSVWLRTEAGRTYPKENEIVVYEDIYGMAYFDAFETIHKIKHTHVFASIWYGKEFTDKWHALKNDPKYRKFAKDILVCAVGAIHRFKFNLMARYIWWLQRKHLAGVKSAIERLGGVVVKSHTDSIAWLGEIPEIPVALNTGQMGAYKWKAENKRAIIISGGQYQVEGDKPVLSGISWGGQWIETVQGERIHYTIFPCIKKGMVIKSYEKDGVEFKELGAESLVNVGGE